MQRREFLRQLALWSAGLTLAQPAFSLAEAAAAPLPPAGGSAQAEKSSAPPTLAWGKGPDYEELVAKVLEPLGGMGAFVKKSFAVVVKPNIGWDRTPDQAANTHPLVVKALAKLALAAGAARVLVFDRTSNDERRAYVNSGIKAAVDSLQSQSITCAFVDERKFVPVKIQQGQAISEGKFYQDALEADCYINVPVAKHHGLARLTLGLKNTMGVLGGDRGKIHQALAQTLADINTVIRPQLTVIDATRILLRNGPQGGKLADVKALHTVLASADPVAADAYATTLFDLPHDALESTRAAAARGLGEMDLNKVKIVKV
ncbi:MAG: DUF362 domain-containing protein [Lentisphaerae bacterium]|nr:DUF362 domain-containing protein [Lentisphaerota bacterium]